VSTGPSADLRLVTKTAREMVVRYGMSPLGARTFGEHDEMIFLGREIHEERDYSDKTAESIDKEVSALIEEGLKRAKQILTERKDKLEKMVARLLEKETIEQDEIKEIMA